MKNILAFVFTSLLILFIIPSYALAEGEKVTPKNPGLIIATVKGMVCDFCATGIKEKT